MESKNDKILLIEKLYDKVLDIIDGHKAEIQLNVLAFAYISVMEYLAKHYPEAKEELLLTVELFTNSTLEKIEKATENNNITRA